MLWLPEICNEYFNKMYTASKVKNRLNIFKEKKTVKLSKHGFIRVTFKTLNEMVTIYSQFGFNHH